MAQKNQKKSSVKAKAANAKKPAKRVAKAAAKPVKKAAAVPKSPPKPAPKTKAAPAKPHAKPAAQKPVAHKAAPKRPVAAAANGKPVPPAKAKPAAPAHRVIASSTGSHTAQRVSAPAQPPRPVAPTHVTPPKAAATQPPQAVNIAKKPVSQRHGFKTNEYIVYPTHGVGRIIGIEEQEIAGMSLELFVIQFEKDKMTLRVPTGKSQSVGMRKLSEDGIVKRAMETLKGKARIKRTMWSRRAQEYETKINSGDLVSIAEVVRDLYRSESQPEQSYSERQLYEAALDRMAREIAAVDKLDERGAVQRITEVLSKSARGRREQAGEADEVAASKAA